MVLLKNGSVLTTFCGNAFSVSCRNFRQRWKTQYTFVKEIKGSNEMVAKEHALEIKKTNWHDGRIYLFCVPPVVLLSVYYFKIYKADRDVQDILKDVEKFINRLLGFWQFLLNEKRKELETEPFWRSEVTGCGYENNMCLRREAREDAEGTARPTHRGVTAPFEESIRVLAAKIAEERKESKIKGPYLIHPTHPDVVTPLEEPIRMLVKQIEEDRKRIEEERNRSPNPTWPPY